MNQAPQKTAALDCRCQSLISLNGVNALLIFFLLFSTSSFPCALKSIWNIQQGFHHVPDPRTSHFKMLRLTVRKLISIIERALNWFHTLIRWFFSCEKREKSARESNEYGYSFHLPFIAYSVRRWYVYSNEILRSESRNMCESPPSVRLNLIKSPNYIFKLCEFLFMQTFIS